MIRIRRPFVSVGKIPTSKSWLNRALILRSLYPDLQILDWNPSEFDGADVTCLARALAALAAGETEFEIGESGTGLRFLMARLSVEKNRFRIRGTSKLMSRPHGELFRALESVGATVQLLDANTLMIEANGWPEKELEIEVDTSESSQFASALLLASTCFKHAFRLKMTGPALSAGYFDMTKNFVESVQAGRRRFFAEADASSAATLAIIGVAASHIVTRQNRTRLNSQLNVIFEKDLSARLQMIEDLVEKTKQPDRIVFEILRGIRCEEGLRAFSLNLANVPDLFPCLAALAAFARVPDGNGSSTSAIVGAPHLRLKESDRISGVARLLKTCGIGFTELSDGIVVTALTEAQVDHFATLRRQGFAFHFDPENDHRLAFAAAVLAAGGVPIEVFSGGGLARGVVTKSFPMFWSMVEGDAPRVAIIGHRGAGKTEAARRWGLALGARATIIDLDREIERLAGKSTREIFETLGELEFRWFEHQAWREIDFETRNSVGAVIVSCGAGFDPTIIDDSWIRVWLRRTTDADGRVFTDRPRLDASVGPLEESLARFQVREPRFAEVSDRVLELGEGTTSTADPSEMPWVADLFDQDLNLGIINSAAEISLIGGIVTLMPGQDIVATCERLLRWGVSRVEIRDDLFPPSKYPELWDFFCSLPADRTLVSFRNIAERDKTFFQISRFAEGLTDVIALDFDCGTKSTIAIPEEFLRRARQGNIVLIASVHQSAAATTRADLIAIENKFADVPRLIVKAALETSDFSQLRIFHEWMFEGRSRRSYLPLTHAASVTSARWSWYRAWFGKKSALTFWREGDGSSFDQPTFSQWWRRSRFESLKFAAVLGDPIRQSRTPLQHDVYFAKRGLPVFAIQMSRPEVKTGLPLLLELGLSAAAVTAPLKEEIVGTSKPVNTVAVLRTGMSTMNTDNLGFKSLWDEAKAVAGRMQLKIDVNAQDIVVWGGGGVLTSIADVLPGAIFYSSSKGQPRKGQPPRIATAVSASPQIVVWASGIDRGAWPAIWKPRLIVDLSYTESSMGRVIAIETGARYVSGLSMFEAQAKGQTVFWDEVLKNSGV